MSIEVLINITDLGGLSAGGMRSLLKVLNGVMFLTQAFLISKKKIKNMISWT